VKRLEAAAVKPFSGRHPALTGDDHRFRSLLPALKRCHLAVERPPRAL